MLYKIKLQGLMRVVIILLVNRIIGSYQFS